MEARRGDCADAACHVTSNGAQKQPPGGTVSRSSLLPGVARAAAAPHRVTPREAASPAMGFLRCGRAEDAAEASTSGRPAEAQGGCCAKPPPAKARQGGGGSRSGSESDSDDDVSLLSGSSASEASAVDAAMSFFGAAPQQARVLFAFPPTPSRGRARQRGTPARAARLGAAIRATMHALARRAGVAPRLLARRRAWRRVPTRARSSARP